MKTLIELTVRNGMVLESYSVYCDEAGDIFIQNVLDAEQGDPTDTMHIDPLALRPIGLALLAAADRLGKSSTDIHPGLVRTLNIVSMDPAGLASVMSSVVSPVPPQRVEPPSTSRYVVVPIWELVPGSATSPRIV